MAEGKITLFQSEDTTGNKPHYNGYIDIDGVAHQFAVWPARSGNGFSGKYKPKGETQQSQIPAPQGGNRMLD